MSPASAQPGQPVFVQANDINGHPYADGSGVTITINGVETVSRYFQFALPGTMKFVVRAVQGAVDEMSTATVEVAGESLMYRRSLGPPSTIAMPIIQASLKPGNPYMATFSLNTPSSAEPYLAKQNSQPPAGGQSTTTPATTPGAASAPVPPAASRPAALAPAAAATKTMVPVRAPTQAPAPMAAIRVGPSVAPSAATAVGTQSAVAMAIASLPTAKIVSVPAKTVTLKDGSKFTTAASLGLVPPGSVNVAPEATSYVWNFGDGTNATTQTPMVTHDYFPAIQANKVAHSFNVSCTAVHDSLTVTRTLVLVSSYGLSKQLGTIVPYHTGDDYAAFQKVAFSGSMIVHNIENQPIVLNSMAVVPISDDPGVNAPAPAFTQMKTPITIQPHSSVGLGVYVTKDQLGNLGPKVNGFTVYYSGNTAPVNDATLQQQARAMPNIMGGSGSPAPVLKAAAKATVARSPAVSVAKSAVSRTVVNLQNISKAPQANVRFSHTFRIHLSDSGRAQATIVSLGSLLMNRTVLLGAVSAVATQPHLPVTNPGGPVMDAATNTVAIPLSSGVNALAAQAQVRASVQAGLGTVAAKAASIRMMSVGGPPPAGPVGAGNVCDPDNISDADAATARSASLACELSLAPADTKEVLIPGSFQNAQQGDVILSPGEDGADNMIGTLLRSLNPPHYHSHSGIMSQNYNEITHCTASPQRLLASNHLVTQDVVGQGIKPDVLQYAWPGSITQTIDSAINGERWNDPEDSTGNTWYKISGFNPEPLGIENDNNDFVLVYPMVVKPLPENEAAARPLLRKAGALARSKGARVDSNGNLTQGGGAYYCFYNYTNPNISAGFTDPAPAGLPSSSSWAQGHSPAVCSSFVWMCMKATGLNLVGPSATETASELSANAVANGEQVGPPSNPSPDGLFYYSTAGREAAGQVLNTVIYNQALQQEGWAQYIPAVGSFFAQNVADQVLNMFAFNNPNMYGSSAWQNPGDANAVAPDDIGWGWNPPYFGYAEELQYLPPHTEEYTVSRWTHVTTYGTVSGTVMANGSPVPGANVSVNSSLTAVTDGSGHFSIPNVPTGPYDLKAWATIWVGGVQVQVANGPNGPSGQGQVITTTPSSPNWNGIVILQTLPVDFRSLALQSMQWSSDHGDANPWHQHGVVNQGPNSASVALGPGIDGVGNVNTYSITYDYNNQGLFRCEYDFTAALLGDLSIEVTLVQKMIDDGSNSVQYSSTYTFNIPVGGTYGWSIWIEYQDGYHNGPAYFSGTATNNQLTS